MSGFVFDVLQEYRGMERTCAPAFHLARNLDPSRPTDPCPMQLYNDVCDWIEQNVGIASVRNAGRAIGGRISARMREAGHIGDNPSPPDVMAALKHAADAMIQDPKKRGWEILKSTPTQVLMRRTQTFNCMLQDGLLLALVERANAVAPRVEHIRCTRRGDAFCEYDVRWSLGPARKPPAPKRS